MNYTKLAATLLLTCATTTWAAEGGDQTVTKTGSRVVAESPMALGDCSITSYDYDFFQDQQLPVASMSVRKCVKTETYDYDVTGSGWSAKSGNERNFRYTYEQRTVTVSAGPYDHMDLSSRMAMQEQYRNLKAQCEQTGDCYSFRLYLQSLSLGTVMNQSLNNCKAERSDLANTLVSTCGQ